MTNSVTITRKIEFDSGHRVPDHKSKCRNAHGHRYVLEVTITGPVHAHRGESDDGMVLDFGDLKQYMQEMIGDVWDHAFLCYEGDEPMIQALELLGRHHRTVLIADVPTVENLVQIAFNTLRSGITRNYPDTELVRVRLYETPNCWADAIRT